MSLENAICTNARCTFPTSTKLTAVPNFCPLCGSKIIEKCPDCAKPFPNLERPKFCPNCGEQVRFDGKHSAPKGSHF